MRISEYTAFFERAFKAQMQCLFVGPPGVGKTVGAQDACLRMEADLIPICTPLCDLAFVAGYPYRNNGTASFAPFGPLARALAATRPTCILWDEFDKAAESVQKAVLRLFDQREVGDRRLPDCVTLMAAANDVGQGMSNYGLIEPLKDRFRTIINVEPNVEDTVIYGLANGWPVDLLAFLRNDPSALMDWKPIKSMQRGGSTPRGWGYCAQWIGLGIDDLEVIYGCVGQGSGTKYLAYRKLINELPDVDRCILDPDGSPVPENPSARYLVMMALASKMSAGNFGQVLRYAMRFPQPMRAFCLLDAFQAERMRKDNDKLPKGHAMIHTSRDFIAWSVSDDGKEIQQASGRSS